MRLTELKIENFRSFKDKTIRFDDYTCFVGANSSGKSNILTALNIFFQNDTPAVTNKSVLSKEDFHHKNIKEPIKITLTFENLSENAQKEFRLYYRQEKLVIFAKADWNSADNNAPVKHYGSRLVMNEFSSYFAADKQGERVAELRNIYDSIRKNFTNLPDISTKQGMYDALRKYEENHPENCKPLDEPNQFFGFTRGEYRLENYIQWIYVPAVKDASSEQDESSKTALGKLLERTVRTKLDFSEEIKVLKAETAEKYTQILDKHKSFLNGIGLSIQKRLQEWITNRVSLDLNWYYDEEKSVNVRPPMARAEIGDGDFIGEIQRAGHGLQRGYLLALLQELAGGDESEGPRLLLAIEEPELYQHPPQAQHFADVLEELSKNNQIIITTHSPYFVRTNSFEQIRIMRKSTSQYCYSDVFSTTWEKVEKRLSTALNGKPIHPNALMAVVNQTMYPTQKEIFFSNMPILVEGLEDIAYIATQLQLDNNWGRFRTLGCHLIPAGNKCEIARYIAIAQEFGISFFVVIDGDANLTRPEDKEKNIKDNICLLKLLSYDKYNPTPEETIWEERLVMWKTKIGDIVRNDFGEQNWQKAENEARNKYGLMDGVRQKNQILISVTLEKLREQELRSANLIKLSSSILKYAECLNQNKGKYNGKS
jgi:predicted ATP-dependent endonuclease of OLD family